MSEDERGSGLAPSSHAASALELGEACLNDNCTACMSSIVAF